MTREVWVSIEIRDDDEVVPPPRRLSDAVADMLWNQGLCVNNTLYLDKDGYFATPETAYKVEVHADRQIADPDNDEFECERCGRILDNDFSNLVGDDQLVCDACVKRAKVA